MPRISAPHQNIKKALPDIVIGDAKVKQQGFVIGQSWVQPIATGEVSGSITIEVKRYAVDESLPDNIGVELAEFNPKQPVYLVGSNDTLLAADTGETVAQRTTENAAQWRALVDAKTAELEPRPVILQGDALELMLTQSVITAEEISRHLAAAPAHHFAPKDSQGQPILALLAP